jgi:sugar-specific transcriptional regulator TrmB
MLKYLNMNRKQSEKYSPSLVKLALTPDEAHCYQILVSQGSLDAKSLAKLAEILPNAVYRLIGHLKRKGFIVELDTYPIRFQALPPDVAINAYSQFKLKELAELTALSLKEITSPPPQSTTAIEQVSGRNAMFAKSAQLINQAKKEVLIISLGEQVPDEIRLADRDAIERGVEIKLIAHKYSSENESLLKAWVKMGLQVRHLPGSGYHMQITDEKNCLIAASNPQSASERSVMIITSEGLSKAMRNYFYMLWEKAVSVKLN